MRKLTEEELESARNEVAHTILGRCLSLLEENISQSEHLQMAQEICHTQRDNPALAEIIAEYTRKADEISDGEFSETLKTWQTKNH